MPVLPFFRHPVARPGAWSLPFVQVCSLHGSAKRLRLPVAPKPKVGGADSPRRPPGMSLRSGPRPSRRELNLCFPRIYSESLSPFQVRGDHLGRNESFEVEWSQDPQVGGFLMSYSANWGNGGYVLIGKEGKLTIGGYGTKEKHLAARFQVVDCDDYTDGSLVSDVLVRQPSRVKGT